ERVKANRERAVGADLERREYVCEEIARERGRRPTAPEIVRSGTRSADRAGAVVAPVLGDALDLSVSRIHGHVPATVKEAYLVCRLLLEKTPLPGPPPLEMRSPA